MSSRSLGEKRVRLAGQSGLRILLMAILVAGVSLGTGRAVYSRMFDVSSTPVTTVSAASFEAVPVAPESVVSAFGVSLATQTAEAFDLDPATPGFQLPTLLGGTIVEVNGRRADLLYVSPTQINYVMPAATEIGLANVLVRSGDGTTSNGTVQVAPVAPAIFAANANGKGAAAALLLRVKGDGSRFEEKVAEFSQQAGRYLTKSIDLGPESDRVFLILFLSGLRGAADPNGDGNLNESVRLLIGGTEVVPFYAGRQPEYVGLDQINVEIPRGLIGRGIVNVAISATGYGASNLVDIEVAGPNGAAPPAISGFGGNAALAGQELLINGSGFSPVLTENEVRIAGLNADVMTATTTQLKVMVPYGVETGTVTVRTLQGEGASSSILPVRTSISGVVEDTLRNPLGNVTVRLADNSATTKTNPDGAFVLADVPAGIQSVEVDGGTLNATPPYPKVTLKVNSQSNRDNQFPRTIAIQQSTGSSGTIGGGGTNMDPGAGDPLYLKASPDQSSTIIQTGDYALEVPPGVKVLFPDGSTQGTVFLTPLENGRTPVDLPFGYYSTSIVQITPFNVKLDPGAKLTFPNNDGLPPGSSANLFRYDSELGRFVQEPTKATVTGDGKLIETLPNAIKVTSIYFVAVSRQTTTITGRVLEKDGTTPVRYALARYRGQEALTDGNGSYVLRFCPVKSGDNVSVDISLLRSIGRVERVSSASVPAVIGGITKMPDVILPGASENRPPVILLPPKLEVDEGKVVSLLLIVADPDLNPISDVKVEGPSFASIVKITLPFLTTYNLRLAPGYADAGTHPLMLTATDSLGASVKVTVTLTVKNVNRTPTAKDVSVTVNEDTEVSITMAGQDEDLEDVLTYSIISGPTKGTLTGTGATRLYKPNLNFNGQDKFNYRVGDGKKESQPATVTITVTPVNDPPALTVPTEIQTVAAGQTLSLKITAADPDQGQTITLSTGGTLPGGLSFVQTEAAAAQLTWTPTRNQVGSYIITVIATDNGSPNASDSKTFQINVTN